MATSPLSEKLRAMRLGHWPDRPVNQSRVAAALGVKEPSISAYENGAAPPPARLRDYAIFFASRRWLLPDAPTRVTLDYLTPAERETFDALNAELTEARGNAPLAAPTTGPTPFWRFPAGESVRIFCGRLDEAAAGRYSTPDDPNYMQLRNAADLDSLVELIGHIRRLNPDSDVRYVLGDRFAADDLSGHVVVLGNIAQIQGEGRLIPDKTLPVTQVDVDHLDGEVFDVELPDAGTDRFEPSIENDRVVQDVGLLARVPNPHNSARTLTVCSGVFTRGVFGAVRSLTDKRLRDGNADALRDRYGNLEAFGVLIRVRVAGDTVPTPDLRDERNILKEFEIPNS